jgi:hypothetical protein
MSWTKVTAKCILLNKNYAKYIQKNLILIDYVVRFASFLSPSKANSPQHAI